MKIALSGSGSTGKTTLAAMVSEKYNIPSIPEFARETAEEMGVKEIRGMTPEQSYDFQNRILQKKIEEEAKHETFIADRCTADNMAYYMRWCVRDFTDEQNKVYMDKCIKQLSVYDLIIVLPWGGIPLEDDGFRSARMYYQYSIHCLIVGALHDLGIKYFIMHEKALEDRVALIGECLKNGPPTHKYLTEEG